MGLSSAVDREQERAEWYGKQALGQLSTSSAWLRAGKGATAKCIPLPSGHLTARRPRSAVKMRPSVSWSLIIRPVWDVTPVSSGVCNGKGRSQCVYGMGGGEGRRRNLRAWGLWRTSEITSSKPHVLEMRKYIETKWILPADPGLEPTSLAWKPF